MQLERLNQEIEKMNGVRYHRVFVPDKESFDESADDVWADTADIYMEDSVSLETMIEELEKTCILDHCRAVLSWPNQGNIHVSRKAGNLVVVYGDQEYARFQDALSQLAGSGETKAVEEIHLVF